MLQNSVAHFSSSSSRETQNKPSPGYRPGLAIIQYIIRAIIQDIICDIIRAIIQNIVCDIIRDIVCDIIRATTLKTQKTKRRCPNDLQLLDHSGKLQKTPKN